MTTATQSAAPEKRSGLVIAALCLGIAGSVLGMVPILGLIAIALGAVGIVLALIGWKKAGKMRYWAVALSALALTLGIIGTVIVSNAVDQLDQDLKQLDQDYQRGNSTP